MSAMMSILLAWWGDEVFDFAQSVEARPDCLVESDWRVNPQPT